MQLTCFLFFCMQIIKNDSQHCCWLETLAYSLFTVLYIKLIINVLVLLQPPGQPIMPNSMDPTRQGEYGEDAHYFLNLSCIVGT